MILLVEAIGLAGRRDHAVDALAVLRVAHLLGQIVGPGAAVAGLPGGAPIAAVEHAGAGDADPELASVVRVRQK
jgi:hypothetical protein